MSDLLTALSVVFVVGGAFLLVANRFGMPTVPFFILAGVVAGRFIEVGITLELARYGIILLVFAFSVGIQFETVRTVLSDSEVVAIGQVLVLGSLGIAVGLLIGHPPAQALFVGIAAAFSSTIVGTGMLQPEIRRNLVHGRIAQTVQFVQDLLAILFVLVLSAGTFAADPIATQLGYGVLLLGAAIVVNRHLFDLLGRLSKGSDELLLVCVIALLIAFLGAAEYVGVSLVVGAFVAGLAVRRDPAEHLGMLNGIVSIRDFFTAVFFVTLGALVTVATVEAVLTAAVLVVLTALVKPAVTVSLLLYEGYEARSATLTSLSLDQVSEFALIIAIEGLLIGTLSQSAFNGIIFAAAVTMITSSLSRRYDEQIYRTFAGRGLLRRQSEKVDERSAVPEDLSGHVVIVGYGRQGRRLVETSVAIDPPYVVVENDPALLDELRSECESYVFGDAMDRYTWEKARVEDARLVVSTVDSERLSERLLTFTGDVDVILRARSASTALELLDRGALYVNVPEKLAAEQLVEHIEALASGEITIEELRERHLAELERQTAAGYYTTADEIRAMR